MRIEAEVAEGCMVHMQQHADKNRPAGIELRIMISILSTS